MKNGTLSMGFKITNMDKNNALLDLGINQGDIISFVNGNSVNSLEQFLASLKSPPNDLVMISRRSNEGKYSPIYIRLH